MIPFYLIFLLIFVVAACEEYLAQKRVIFWIFAIVLIIFAGFRASGVDLDYVGYANWYDEAPTLDDVIHGDGSLVNRDPGYTLVCSIFKSLGLSFQVLILIMAFATVILRMAAIWKLSPAPLLSVLFYFPYLFLLQEMTQIRAGMAAALFLCAIPLLAKRKYLAYVAIILLAAVFHYSALVFLGFLLLRSPEGNPRYYLIGVVASVVLAMLGLTADFVFLRIAESGIDSRLSYYATEAAQSMGTTNLFNSTSVPNLVLSIALLVNYDRLKEVAPYATYVIRIQVVSVMIFFLLSGYPVMAFRLSELVVGVGMIAWPFLIYVVKNEWIRILMFLIVGMNFLISTLRLMQDYSVHSWDFSAVYIQSWLC